MEWTMILVGLGKVGAGLAVAMLAAYLVLLTFRRFGGIGDVQELRDNVRYAPVRGPFKIYIIDEVHMLTREAFNAILKTLEEPPPHVKFFFATTEPQKVPTTILSRCQRFDFKRIKD